MKPNLKTVLTATAAVSALFLAGCSAGGSVGQTSQPQGGSDAVERPESPTDSGSSPSSQTVAEFRNMDVAAAQVEALYPGYSFTQSTWSNEPVLDSVVGTWNGFGSADRMEWCDWITADITDYGIDEAADLAVSANEIGLSRAAAVEWSMAQWGVCAVAYDSPAFKFPIGGPTNY